MTLVPEVEETVLEADAPSTNRKKRFSRSLKIGMTGVGIVIAVAIVSRFWLPGGVDSIRAANVQARLLPPFADMRYPLGTDHLGRDLVAEFLRVLDVIPADADDLPGTGHASIYPVRR